MPFDPKADDGGWFADTVNKLKLDKKDPRVVTAESMYQKALKGSCEKGNASLKKAAGEKNEAKRKKAEQEVIKTHQADLTKVRQETGKVLGGFAQKK